MFSIAKLIVLIIFFETTLCQNDYSFTRARFRRETHNQNASDDDGTSSDPKIQTTKADVDEIIPKIFSVSNSGLVLFNLTNTPSERNIDSKELQQDQPFSEKQDFKVQRNPDGKLNIVFNDVFFPQKSSMSQRSNTPSVDGTPRPIDKQPSKDFFFPDEIDLDPSCKKNGKSFCTDVQNYPEAKVEDMLKNQISRFDVLFGDDDITQPLNISQRMSPGEDSLCKSTERVIYPKAGESKDLKWLYIVNQQNYTQAVKIEECVNPDSACMFADSFPNGYVTMCKQSFIYRQLVAFTKNGDIVKDNFKLPSCCKCIYKPK